MVPPIDYKALQATWEHPQEHHGGYKIASSGIYSSIASVERDGDDFKVKVTFSAPYYPLIPSRWHCAPGSAGQGTL